MVKVQFNNEQSLFIISPNTKKAIKEAISATLEYLDFSPARGATVSVSFTDNAGIREINLKYREKDAPTDVLSFPLINWSDPDDDEVNNEGMGIFPVELGDIILSLERCREQAIEFGHSFMREVSFLTVHSTLHLMGFDHETSESDEAEMFSIQDIIMRSLGYIKQ